MSFAEYPKALYQGEVSVTVVSKEEEEQYRTIGYLAYGEKASDNQISNQATKTSDDLDQSKKTNTKTK